MVNGDGNENDEKQTKTKISRSNWQKKSLAVQHNFLYISLPLLLQRETSKLHVLWRKCRMCSQKILLLLFLFAFFHCPSFLPYCSLAVLIFFPTVYHVVLPKKFVSFVFFSSLFWLSVGLQFSLSSPSLSPTFSGSLSFSFSTFQICGHDN